MKIYRPNNNTYVVQKNGLPYEVTKEENSELHLKLENEMLANSSDFEIDLQEELSSIEIPMTKEQQRLLDLEIAMTKILGGTL